MSVFASLLNIFSHVIDEVIPGPPPTKPTLPSLPNAPSLSPIRRKTLKGAVSGKDDTAASQGTPAKDKASGRTSVKGFHLTSFLTLR
jgi:huntingtin